jgi:glycerate kinase
MRILVAPDKFKGTLSAEEAAGAIARGWLRRRPEDGIAVAPMADGGEGTLETLASALGGTTYPAEVTGPLGDRVTARYGMADPPGGRIAIVEMARASGLGLVVENRRDPKLTTTRGTGELMLAACSHRPRSVIVCIGGSATNDGGAGMAQAVGVALNDAHDRPVRAGGAALIDLATIDVDGLDRSLDGVEFVVACDVDNPLAGPNGASAIYGPQKGATPEDVAILDRALSHFAAVIERDLGLKVADVPGAGAAGGLGAGLIAFLGARLRPGVTVVMDALGLPERIGSADLVLTGEGSFDDQSMRGKVAMGVAEEASRNGVPAVILAGRANVEAPGVRVESLSGRFGEERSLADAARALEDLAAEVAASWPA